MIGSLKFVTFEVIALAMRPRRALSACTASEEGDTKEEEDTRVAADRNSSIELSYDRIGGQVGRTAEWKTYSSTSAHMSNAHFQINSLFININTRNLCSRRRWTRHKRIARISMSRNFQQRMQLSQQKNKPMISATSDGQYKDNIIDRTLDWNWSKASRSARMLLSASRCASNAAIANSFSQKKRLITKCFRTNESCWVRVVVAIRPVWACMPLQCVPIQPLKENEKTKRNKEIKDD